MMQYFPKHVTFWSYNYKPTMTMRNKNLKSGRRSAVTPVIIVKKQIFIMHLFGDFGFSLM